MSANFGFNIAALAAKSAKQASLPPLRPRRTPTPSARTPRSAASSRRRRSASVQRTASAKRRVTPRQPAVTPQLGKRKRGSPNAQSGPDDGEPDELSPDRDDEVRSVEKSRKVAGTVSPIPENADEDPDELSILVEDVGSIQRPKTRAPEFAQRIPATRRVSAGGAREKTPIADRISTMSISSRTAIVRRSTGTPPITPGMLPNGRPRLSSASHFGPEFTTPSVPKDGEDSEDELSPPQINEGTPRIVGAQPSTHSSTEQDDSLDLDELSPAQPANPQKGPELPPQKQQAVETPATSAAVRRGRLKRIVVDEEDEVQVTPAAIKPPPKETSTTPQEETLEDDAPDELSPDITRARLEPSKEAPRETEFVEVSSAEDSDSYEPDQEEESTIRPRASPKRMQAKPAGEAPPRKRQRYSGPKQAISVMRIKGSMVRGITVADTTRTILEQSIDHRLERMARKVNEVQDPARRKQIRGEINLTLAFKESLDEKLLDLQDANDTLNVGFQKKRLFKSSNIARRKEILALQNSRHEIELETDYEQAVFESEKAKVEERSRVNASLFEIQAAIQSGRERAKRLGREDEGPEVPLSMLLESLGRDVGSVGGGLLESVKDFNRGLERAAGWLEGRA